MTNFHDTTPPCGMGAGGGGGGEAGVCQIKHPILNRTLLNIFYIPFLGVCTPKADIWFMMVVYCHYDLSDSDLDLAEVT